MNEQIHEHLSALMDGELGRDQTRFLLKRMTMDRELPLRWTRYHIVRRSLRRQEFGACNGRLVEAVMARIERESLTPVRTRANWLHWGGGSVIAASVAVAALMVTRPVGETTSVPTETVAQAGSMHTTASIDAADVAATSAAPHAFRPPMLAPNSPVDTAPVNFGTTSDQPIIIDPQMQSYLIRRYQPAGGVAEPGFGPYVLLANPPHDNGRARSEGPAPESR